MGLGMQQGEHGAVYDEKRRWKRYQIEVNLRARVRSAGEAKLIHGQGSDISIGGMAMFLPADLVVGETIDLEVTLPYTTAPLQIAAVVRSRRSYHYGVEYVNPTAAAAAAIHRACTSLSLVQ